MEQRIDPYEQDRKALDAGYVKLIHEIVLKMGVQSEIGKALRAALQLAIEEQEKLHLAHPTESRQSLKKIMAEVIFGGAHLDGRELESEVMLELIRNYADSALRADMLRQSVKDEQKAIDLAGVDPLTQTYNRRKAMQILSDWLPDPPEFGRREHVEKKKFFPFAIVLIDIDHFKRINDTFGHPEGDKILVGLTRFLKENLRTAPRGGAEIGDDVVIRHGGEEFMLLIRADEKQVAAKLDELQEKLRITHLSEKVPDVRMSIGWTMFKPELVGVDPGFDVDQSPENLVQEADDALYVAKQNGRDSIWRY